MELRALLDLQDHLDHKERQGPKGTWVRKGCLDPMGRLGIKDQKGPLDQPEPRVKKETRAKQEGLDLKGQLGHRENLAIQGQRGLLVIEDQ